MIPEYRAERAFIGSKCESAYALRGYGVTRCEMGNVELLFTPSINQDVHAVFLKQIAESDPASLHVIVMDQAGFHMKQEDGRIPANIRVLPLPPYCPELNPAEWFGRVVKAPTVNRIYGSLEKLENHLIAVARGWSEPSKVASLVHQRMRDQVNAAAASQSLLVGGYWYCSPFRPLNQ